MKKYVIMLLSVAFFCGQTWAQQPTIHAILTIDRDDKSIGCEVDEANIKRILDQAGLEASMSVKYYATERTITDIRTQISNLSVSKDDAIFYYYSGHGYRYQNQTAKYPYLALKDASLRALEAAPNQYEPKNKSISASGRTNALGLEEISNLLKAKNVRLVMTIGDLCNSPIPAQEPAPIPATITTLNNYERLFKKAKGYLIVCSSKPGQPSLGSSTMGGAFTNSVLEAYKEAVKASSKADWRSIFSKSYELTRIKTSSHGREPQTPIVDEINVTYID